MRTACAPQSWRRSLPSWTAGRPNQTPASILQGLGVAGGAAPGPHGRYRRPHKGQGPAGAGAVRSVRTSSCWTSRRTTWTSSPSTGWRTFCWTSEDTVIIVSPRPPFPEYRLHPHRGYRLRQDQAVCRQLRFLVRVQPADAAAHPQARTSAMRKRSPSCRSLSRASPPTSPRASRPPARRKLLDKLTRGGDARLLPALSLCRLHAGAGGGQGHPVCRRTSARPSTACKLLDQVSFIAEPGRQDRLCRRERAARRRRCSKSSWANWSRTRAPSNGASPRQPELLPQGQHRVFRRPTMTPLSTGCASISEKKDDVYLRGLPGADAVLRRGRLQAGAGALRR